jgi:FkbM family methyltransferase
LSTARKIRSKLKRFDPLRRREVVQRRSGKKEVCNRIRELVVEDILLKVAEFAGEFYIDPRSDLCIRVLADGFFEPELVSVAMQATDPERDVIDVGANVGFYTVLIAKKLRLGSRVAAFEPAMEAFDNLIRNVRHNEVEDKVLALPYAASHATGPAPLYHVSGRSEYSSLMPIVHPSAASSFSICQDVSTVTIDEIVEKHELRPAFIKVDVEGSEHLVLAGARRTIQSHRPVMLMEVSDQLLRAAGSSAKTLIEYVRSYDYIVLDPVKPKREPGTRAFGDIVCFPKEGDQWKSLVLR